MAVRMFGGITSVALCALLAAGTASAQFRPMAAFYPLVDSLCHYPPLDKQMEIVAQKKIDRWYVSFVGVKGEKKVLLAAATLEPLTDPKTIALVVDFAGMKPNTGKVPTWGYVFDRNRDGLIDYMALVEGAAPYKDADFPDDFPRRGQPLTPDQMEYYVGRCQLVFNHFADENGDNLIDAFVHIDLDPKREWVERHIVARSLKFNDKFDDVWAFTSRIDEPHQPVDFTPDRILYHPLDNPNSELTAKTLGERSAILQLFNKAAKACKLSAKDFVRLDRTE